MTTSPKREACENAGEEIAQMDNIPARSLNAP